MLGLEIREPVLTIGDLKIPNQSIGVAITATGMPDNVDGILGSVNCTRYFVLLLSFSQDWP